MPSFYAASFSVGDDTGNNTVLFGVENTTANNAWHNIVGVSDATTLYIYLDGVQKNTAVRTKTGTPSISAALAIGNWITYSAYYNGQVDDVRLYNRALTAAEVAQLYSYSDKSRGFFALSK